MVTRREEEWEVAVQGREREFDVAVTFVGFDGSVERKKDVHLMKHQERVTETVLGTAETQQMNICLG